MATKTATKTNNLVNFEDIKISIDRNVFLKSLGRLQSIVEKRNTSPILSNIRIEAVKSAVRLTATDMDISAIEEIPAETLKEGSVTTPAHTLYDIVRKLPDGSKIELEIDAAKSNQLQVKCGTSKFNLSCLPAADFPTISEGQMPHNFTISAKDALGLIDKTKFAISNEETRYYLNGIYIHSAETSAGQVLRSVATDGHRLAKVEIALPSGASGIPGVIIPKKAVYEVKKIIEEDVDSVTISLSKTKIKFTAGNTTLVSKLIDGTFPDYDRVIPKNNDKIMEVDSMLFTQAVDRVSTISNEKTRAVKLSVKNGKLVLSANSPESGSASEENSVNFTAEPIEIGFNSRYLLDIMSQLEGDTTQFVFSDSASPAIVRDPSDVTALYVVMPMRV